MSNEGYQGTHQDWLEDRASHQLEREAFMREQRFPLWQFEGWHDGKLQVAIPGIGAIRLTEDQAVQFANAILSEVELAQRGDTE